MEVTFLLALAAGVVAFASPCFLPIVPVYLSYLAGTTPGEVASTRAARWAAVRQASMFVAGFTVVFVALWASIGLIGWVVGDYRGMLRILGGSVLIVVGLHVAGLVEVPPLRRTIGISPARAVRVGAGARPAPGGADVTGPTGAGGGSTAAVTAAPAVGGQGIDVASLTPSYRRSALMGLAFGAGWTPCIGPMLGAVIGLATVSGTVWQGAWLLLAFSLGLGLPFVLVAAGATEISARLQWLRRHETAVSLVSGGLLVVTGFLIVAGVFDLLAALSPTLL